ncbi:L,D-transpeptidase family protein [Phaeovulum vinaykumarii]|uniref:L,D-transpeptidase catalytic domain n=1 Tax=Phaeovulum vinaykumarii TaxID=407234 RepID=A0A1N7KQ39_9RHOB|nr:L,D-transpeptidase family protein [Phaeovulum vinaykumarii]SIS63723.1 L,D-transpeptidase catalytic domain [Phaeovulum vinaykumarii]SOC01823.1 L,D-transpeptidase-like protein [Phaeovulum vinaykumarii]
MNANDLILTPTGLIFRNRRIPVVVGRGGLRADKHEGDGATPLGAHRIVGMLYRADRIARARLPHWAVPIGPNDLWCDAPLHEDYNHMVAAPFAASAERLRRADPMYDLVLVTDWNWPEARAHRGSAIFVHAWRRPGFPTAGCVAMARGHLLWLAARLDPDSRLIVRGERPPRPGIAGPGAGGTSQRFE